MSADQTLLSAEPQYSDQVREKELGDLSPHNAFDRAIHAQQALSFGALSPAAIVLAYLDWALHLANAPGRQLELAKAALHQWSRLMRPERWAKPAPQDRRFNDEGWSCLPFNYIAQTFLLGEEWLAQVTGPLPGVSNSHKKVIAFAARQMLDAFSPSNFAFTNPEVLRASLKTAGWSFINGARHFTEDMGRLASHESLDQDDHFAVGKNLGMTPGKVVFRNELMELIQYEPTTSEVVPEPVLIVPAWIMKYYILDLSPHNSLIRYLVSQGLTVFCISWKNPDAGMRDIGLDEYRRLGIMAAFDSVQSICGTEKVHACGYCLGGTLLTAAAAAMARDGDDRLASLTSLAAQTDFTEAGELLLFIDESELALLEDVMWRQGYLDGSQMAGAFQILRSNDLFWSRMIKAYLLGEREQRSDLMTWNADATRMPYKMQTEYLRSFFLNDDLAEGRFFIDGAPVTVSEITVPMFVVGTETDHIAPWRSVYKIHLLNQGDITFVLTSGGHNAGIVSEPGHPHRHFKIARRSPGSPYLSPENWERAANDEDGSWWPNWVAWLKSQSGVLKAAPPLGLPGASSLGPAPGTYVYQT